MNFRRSYERWRWLGLVALGATVVGGCIYCACGPHQIDDGHFWMTVVVQPPEGVGIRRVRYTQYIWEKASWQEQIWVAAQDDEKGQPIADLRDTNQVGDNQYEVGVGASWYSYGNCVPVQRWRGSAVLVRVDLTNGKKSVRILPSPPIDTPKPRYLYFDISADEPPPAPPNAEAKPPSPDV